MVKSYNFYKKGLLLLKEFMNLEKVELRFMGKCLMKN